MKKIFVIIFTVIMIICSLPFYACGGGDSGNTPGEPEEPRHTHIFDREVPTEKYLKSKATFTESAVYYKSCECGEKGEATFSYGSVKAPLTEEEKAKLSPSCLTVSLFDTTEEGFVTYSFNWNTENEPERETIQIFEGQLKPSEDFPETYDEYVATNEKQSSFDESDKTMFYYVSRVTIKLKTDTYYTYRIFDTENQVGGAIAALRTCNPSTETFTFSHVSDSQESFALGMDKESNFKKTLSKIAWFSSFAIHTGDVVEYSKYESYWKRMLDGSFDYLSALPVMAISGNHETTYKNGSNETYKHFYNNIPEQNTYLGYYYSFTYGNAKFIMLNSNVLTANKLKDDQYNWLVSELENNDKLWTIVSIHNPLYSVGTYGANPNRNAISLALRNQLAGLFAKYGVDLVLQGHDHCVSRTYPIGEDMLPKEETTVKSGGINYSVNPQGTIYIMNGPAGSQTRDPYGEVDKTLYSYAEGSYPSTWADIEISGNKLTVKVKKYSANYDYPYKKWGIIKDDTLKNK